jgi:hypothetical protein
MRMVVQSVMQEGLKANSDIKHWFVEPNYKEQDIVEL